MKSKWVKFFAIIFSLLLIVLACSCNNTPENNGGAGNGGDNEEEVTHTCEFDTSKVVYKEKGNKLYIGNPCTGCEEMQLTEEVINVDYIVTTENLIQEFEPNTVVVFKEGEYSQYLIAEQASYVKFYAETGVKIGRFTIAEAREIQVENFSFLAVSGGELSLGNINGIVINNCHFKNSGRVFSGSYFLVNNVIIKNCSFIGVKNNNKLTAVNIKKYNHLTIKDCYFEDIEYNAIQIGNDQATGDLLIEGNTFKNIASRVVYLAQIRDLTTCVVKGNTFYDNTHAYSIGDVNQIKKPNGIYIHTGSETGSITIGVNTWELIPDKDNMWITERAKYNKSEQLQLTK